MKTEALDLARSRLRGGSEVILFARRGSHAHGTYVPSSDPSSIDDIDTLGVFVYPVEYYLGVPVGPGWRETVEVMEGEQDIVCYELRKFVRLLLKSNPNVLMILHLRPEDYLYVSPLGQLLLDNKEAFSSRQAATSFVGYAHGQLKRMTHFQKVSGHRGFMGAKRKALVEKYGYDAKNSSHLIRLLRMGIEFLSTGRMHVFRQDARELIDIKQGKWTLGRIEREADKLFAELRRAESESPLPKEPDHSVASSLVMRILSSAFGKVIL